MRAVEFVDACVGRIVRTVLDRGGGAIVTADHGNAEEMIDPRTGTPHTAHTTSPVPVILCGTAASRLRDGGGLRDVAPTVLDAMKLAKPAVMTGTSLSTMRRADAARAVAT